MNLIKKKQLAARTLGAGKDRIVFNKERAQEIQEAITKQDIRDLVLSGAIFVKERKGRRTHEKSKKRRREGSIKKKVVGSKKNYIILTRKLRAYISELHKQEEISKEQHMRLRKEIKASLFKSKAHIKEHIAQSQ